MFGSLLSLARVAGNALARINPSIVLGPPATGDLDTVSLYWHSPPEYFVIEWTLLHALLVVPALCVLPGWAWHVLIPAKKVSDSSRRVTTADAILDVFEKFCSTCFALCAVGLIYFKTMTPPAAYICMPCHLHMALLLALRFGASAGNEKAGFIFNIGFISSAFGPALALVSPDFRDLSQIEVVHFVVEHILLLLLPAIWVAQRRWVLHGGPVIAYAGWLLYVAMHYDVSFPVSILGSANVSYILAPPNNGPLRLLDRFYRLGLVSLGFVLAPVAQAAYRGVAWASGAFREAATEAAAARVAAALLAAVESKGNEPAGPSAACSDASSTARKDAGRPLQPPASLVSVDAVQPSLAQGPRRRRVSNGAQA